MTSVTVELWKDIGFTEGCLEVPKVESTLPAPDFTFESLEVSTASMFTELKIRSSLLRLLPCSYLAITIEFNSGGYGTFYGWIDKVIIGSDSEDSPMTRIQWHVDLWRTYISKVTLGAGIVKRRTASGDLPPQSYSNRFTLAGTPLNIVPESEIVWAFMNMTETAVTSEGSQTSTVTYCWPVSISSPTKNFQPTSSEAENVTFICPSYYETVLGTFDEFFKIDPDAIISVFLSPVPPTKATISGSDVKLVNWHVVRVGGKADARAAFRFDMTSSENVVYAKHAFTAIAQTTDTVSHVITDMDRVPVGVLPWGISVRGGTYRLINAMTTMYLKFWFTGSISGATFSEGSQPANGLEFTIPLKTLGVTTNAKSSYIYSGQQELDREQMAIQRQQALYSGLAHTVDQGVQGAMGGAFLGMATGGSAAMGAKVGGASSAAGGIVGTVGDYFITGWANDKMMDATIRQKAQQTSYLTLPSEGQDWCIFGHAPQLVPLEWDSYSTEQRAQDIALYGAHVEEPRTSCQSLLIAGGPLQIVNCTVTGSVPPEAKRYIKDRLASGVRII